MIKKTTRKAPAGRTPIQASSSITAGVANRSANRPVMSSMAKLDPSKRAFARQIQANISRAGRNPIMGATNTSNIMARPDFMELLPMFVQKLYILDVFGSVAMKSRQQIIPYFKFVAENSKGETKKGDILSSPFVNRQGIDPNFTGRVVKNEIVGPGAANFELAYGPVLPASVTITAVAANGNEFKAIDDGAGNLKDVDGQVIGTIDYSTGVVASGSGEIGEAEQIKATYQYDNETAGPDADGQYGAQMGKGYLVLDEINMKAEAHQLACYWSIYSAFAAQQEYGSNIADIAKEAAFSEITAEINSMGFGLLAQTAAYKPQFNWDASPVLSGSVVPSDYLNMFKLKLGQAAASIYQATRLSRPNRLIVGSNCAEYIAMINGFKADAVEDTVGPYKFGTLDQFEIFVDPNYNPDTWVMACKSNDIRRNSALFGEYMPLVATDAIGLANSSVQQGYASMFGMKIINPATVVSGKILGTF